MRLQGYNWGFADGENVGAVGDVYYLMGSLAPTPSIRLFWCDESTEKFLEINYTAELSFPLAGVS